jgi:hypothetical protein
MNLPLTTLDLNLDLGSFSEILSVSGEVKVKRVLNNGVRYILTVS